MNGVEGIGSTGFISRVPRVTAPASTSSTKDPEGKSVGLEGALKMAGDFVKHSMTDIGFVDLQAGINDQLKVFVKHGSVPEEEVETGLDSATATELAGRMGAQITGEVNLAMRIMSQIDPERVAALLK